MQVVYSGGSATPSPSPRLQRKAYQGYGRPVMPGYLSGPPAPMIVSRSKEKVTEGDTSLRDSIPAMSKPLAICCLIMNILLPGLGTFVAGTSVLCCAHVRPKGSSKKNVIWVNSGVAFLQFLTAFLFLLGWIWSIMWGAAFISISAEYYKHSSPVDGTRPKDNHPKTSSPRRAHASNSRHHHSNGSPVNHSKQTSNPYVAPSSSGQNLTQPIIVLQEAPVLNHSEVNKSPSKPIMNARTRHQKILQRQMSDNELSPFKLTNERLEALVIHDLPVPPTRSQRAVTLEDVESFADESETPVVHKT